MKTKKNKIIFNYLTFKDRALLAWNTSPFDTTRPARRD